MSCSCKSGKSTPTGKADSPISGVIVVTYSEIKPHSKPVDESKIFNIRLWDAVNKALVNAEPYVCLEAARADKRSFGDRAKDILVLWDTADDPMPIPVKGPQVTND